MIQFVLVMGFIWVVLTLLEPLVAYIDAGKACDRKYAFDRIQRARTMEEMAASHRASPLYQQMKEEKQLSKRKLRRKEYKARRAQLKREQRIAGQPPAVNGKSSSPKNAGQSHGRIIQKKK